MTDDESLDGYCGADPDAARKVMARCSDGVPAEYAAELRAAMPGITEAGIASYWRARHLPTD